MSKIKTKVVYHEADLDGVTSGALMLLNSSEKDEDVELIPYDYHKDFNQKLTNGHEVYMIDVSLKTPKMFDVAKSAAEFYLVDHHISAYEDLKKYCEENEIVYTEEPFGPALKITVKEFNFVYFYASKISACELTMLLFCKLGEKATDLVHILGQYDTWRKEKPKHLPYDKDWDKVVMPIQYALRSYQDPVTISKVLWNLDNGGTKYNLEKLIDNGSAILHYLKCSNKRKVEEFSFSFEMDGVKFLAMNTSDFNSFAFDHYWDENVFDAMLAFNFTGKDWRISLYTTKTETVDILKIAKFFGGGGHKGACGFRIPHHQMIFRKNKLEFGVLTLLDLNAIPASYKGVDVNDLVKMLKAPTFFNVEEKPVAKILELNNEIPIIFGTGGEVDGLEEFDPEIHTCSPEIDGSPIVKEMELSESKFEIEPEEVLFKEEEFIEEKPKQEVKKKTAPAKKVIRKKK